MIRTVAGVEVETFASPGLVAFTPVKHGDARGFLSEVYSQQRLKEIGIDAVFVQDNHTFSAQGGVIRGLHFQIPPHEQGKLIRVVRGAVLDVVVDIRHGSPTFGASTAVELSADNWRQLFVPAGFAHAFCTLTDNAEVLYKMTASFSAESDRGLAFDDPDLAIDWPVDPAKAILSDKDRHHPRLKDLSPFFRWRSGK